MGVGSPGCDHQMAEHKGPPPYLALHWIADFDTTHCCCDQSLPGTKQVLNSSVVVDVKHGPLLNRSALAASSYTTATAHHANSLGPNLTTRAILQIHMDPGWHTAYYHWHNLVHLPLHWPIHIYGIINLFCTSGLIYWNTVTIIYLWSKIICLFSEMQNSCYHPLV